jgi:hypothetical protein
MTIWECDECGAENPALIGPVGGPPPAFPLDLGQLRCESCGHEQNVTVRGPAKPT